MPFFLDLKLLICYILIGDIMLLIGSHVGYSSKTGLVGSLDEALTYNATTFMFYTGAPQNTNRCEIDLDITKKALEKMKEVGIDKDKIIVHAPYIINLANTLKYDFAVHFLKEELKRCNLLGMKYLVLHPGSHVGLGVDVAIDNIVRGLNEVLGEESVTILIETMAGKGTEVGKTFDEIARIIAGIDDSKKNYIGVCMDTCHLNDAGYDLTDFDKILSEFDGKIGLKYLKCIHINDSKNPLNSHKDRHENIGYGTIGFETLIKIIYHEKLVDIPKILETPYIEKKSPYKEEIEMIREKKFNSSLKTN